MQGIQPAAQRLAHIPKPQHFADGGAVGFGARGLAGLRAMIPKVQAMGYQQAAPAPAPAPVPADGRAAQLMAMIPQMEAMGFRQQPQRLAKGGLVRGPGTGTSDSIPDEAEPGTFIMPADSTAEIGPSALEKMGTMPVRLSNGEFKLPPEQVMAIGEAVLKLMKDATHTPVNGVDGGQTDEEVAEARGFAAGATERMAEMPEQLYADGGRVRQRFNVDEWAAQQNQAREEDNFAVQRQAQAAQAEAEAAARPESPVGMTPSEAYSAGLIASPTPSGYNPAYDQRLSGAQPKPAYADGGLVENNVTRVGNSYSGGNVGGNITVNGGAPAGTFSENPANRMAVAPSPALAPTPVTPAASAAPVGTQPAATAVSNPSPAVATSSQPPAPMGWAERNAQRNAEVSAASITNRPEWSKTPAQPRPAGDAYQPPPPPQPTPLTQQITPTTSTFQSRAGTGFQPKRFADGGIVEDDLQKRLMQIPTGGPAGWTGGGAQASPAPAPALSAMAAAPAPAPVAAPALAGALSRAAAMTPPAPAPAVQALSAMPANPTGGQVSTQNMDGAQGLARRGAADAMANMPNAPAPVQAPVVRHSGNDWQARNDLRNALVSASSITNDGGRWDRHKGVSPERSAYQAMVETDQALKASAPGLALQTMREQGDSQRAGLQVAANSANAAADRMAAPDRTLVTERGNNTRAGIAALGTTEAARLKAAQDGKAPPGYRWTAGGNMEAIPGGPADLKQNKEGVQQGKDTQDIFSILNEARPLLAGATGSYVGVAYDKLGQSVGIATDGAKATAQLKALEGSLVSKMPKMSGPQSDKDVLLYKQMAGQIGDATIPIEQRRAAMDTIENLNMKYLPPVQDAAGYDAIPSGAYYRTPSGDVRRKS